MNRQDALRATTVGLLCLLSIIGIVSLVVGLAINDYSRFNGPGGLLAIAVLIAVAAVNIGSWIALPAVSAYLTHRGWPGVRILVSIIAGLNLITAIGGDFWNLISLAISLGALVLVWLPTSGFQRRARPAP